MVHLKPRTVEVRRRVLSKIPKPDKLTAAWWRRQVKRLAPSTLQSERVVILQVLEFLGRSDQADAIRGIKLPRREDSVTVEDLYTKDELDRIFEATTNTRDRALVQVLYESAARAGELVSMDFKNVRFEEDGTATVIIKGKTGTRSVPIFASVPALRDWMNVHPVGEGPIWVTLRRPYTTLTTTGLYMIIEAILDLAGVKDKKRIVHMFRHSRITELVRLGVRGQPLHKLVGWSKRSNMEAVYVHLSTADVENEVRSKVFGLESEPQEPTIKPQTCPRCRELNEPKARYCSKCNTPLSDVVISAISKDERISKLEEKLDLVAKLLGKQLGIDNLTEDAIVFWPADEEEEED